MKKLIIFMAVLALANLAIGDRVKTTDYFMSAGSIIDTAAAGQELTPDSVRVTTYHNALAPVFDGWYNTGDAACSAGYGNDIVVNLLYSDIDGAGGDGTYYTRVQYYNLTYGLYHKLDYWWEVGNYGDTLQRNASTLVASDNIGINADDVAGDFEYTNFNGVSAWWNEGKTGYSITGAITTFDGLNTSLSSTHGASSWATATGFSTFNPATTPVTPTDTIQSGDSVMTLADTTACQGAAGSLTANEVLTAFKSDCSTTGTGLDSIFYAYFTYSTREDAFKGSGTGATAEEVWTYGGTRSLTDKAGFSLASTGLDGVTQASGSVIFSNTSIATVTNGVTVTTNNDKTGYSLTAQDWTTDSDITQLKADLATDHGAGAWTTAISVAVSDKTGFKLAADGLDSDTSFDQIQTIINNMADSLLNAITDANKANFMASGFSTFDPTTTPVIPDDTTKTGKDIATLDDSLHYQGSASSLTAQAIYDKFVEGSNEEAFWGTGSGNGTESCTLYVYDQDTAIVSNCDVYGYSNGTGNQIAYDNTGSDGYVILSFNPGDVDVRLGTLPGFSFTEHYDLTVTQDSTWTLFGTQFAPASPSPGFTNIVFYINNPGLDTFEIDFTYQLVDSTGSVFGDTIAISYGSGNNTMLLSKWPYTASSDSSLFSKNILSSDSIRVDGDLGKIWYSIKIQSSTGMIFERDTLSITGAVMNPFAP